MNSEETVFTRKTPDCPFSLAFPQLYLEQLLNTVHPPEWELNIGSQMFFLFFFYILVLVFHVQFCCWICDMSVSWATYKSPQTTSSSLHRLFLHRSDLSYTLFQFLKDIPVGYSSKLFPPPFWAGLLLGFPKNLRHSKINQRHLAPFYVGVAIAEAEVQQPDDGSMGDARVWRVAVSP